MFKFLGTTGEPKVVKVMNSSILPNIIDLRFANLISNTRSTKIILLMI